MVLARRTPTGFYELFCEACARPLDIVDSRCMQWLTGNNERVLCFDCEGDCDIVPAQLLPDEGGIVALFTDETRNYVTTGGRAFSTNAVGIYDNGKALIVGPITVENGGAYCLSIIPKPNTAH